MKNNLIKDLSALTGVKEYNFTDLEDKIYDLLGHYSNCCKQCKNNIFEVDIGIATLVIQIDSNEVKYKFIPSKKLDKSIKQSFDSKNSVMLEKVQKEIGRRINKTYKELY